MMITQKQHGVNLIACFLLFHSLTSSMHPRNSVLFLQKNNMAQIQKLNNNKQENEDNFCATV